MSNEVTINVTCDKSVVLSALEKNRSFHAKVVEEAKKGFLEKAKKVFEKKLSELSKGKITSLYVNLNPPKDHTKDYDTVIAMLKMHTGSEIVLSSSEFRRYVEDDWSWAGEFYAVNSLYSRTANDMATSQGMTVYGEED